jgi:LysM repeat protein
MSKERLHNQILDQKATRREFFNWCGEVGKYVVAGTGIVGFLGSSCWMVSKLGERLRIGRQPETPPPPSKTEVPLSTKTPLSQELLSPPPQGQYYEVKKGDNLYRIALRFGTTVEAIAEANQIANPRLIHTGQILYITSYAPSMEVVHDLLSPEERLKADKSYEGIYYHPGELNSSPERQEGFVHIYGLGEPLNPNYASGFPFEREEYVCASWLYPIGTWLKVTNVANNETVYCRVKDRGPNRVDYPNIIADLTKGARDEIAPSWVKRIQVVIEPAR